MSRIRMRLQRLERQDERTAYRRTVGVGVLPGEDEEAKIREACERAGIPREVAHLAIIRISCSGEPFEPRLADGDLLPGESERGNGG